MHFYENPMWQGHESRKQHLHVATPFFWLPVLCKMVQIRCMGIQISSEYTNLARSSEADTDPDNLFND